jgi:hypothetical protein
MILFYDIEQSFDENNFKCSAGENKKSNDKKHKLVLLESE